MVAGDSLIAKGYNMITFNCEACGKELTDGIYCADWLSGIVTEDKGHSTDLCESCQGHMISAVEKAWGEIHKKQEEI